MLNFNCDLQADILYFAVRYSRFDFELEEDRVVHCTNPIEAVYHANKGKPLLLLGEGGQGKSTVVSFLKAKLQLEGVPCFVMACRDFRSVSELKNQLRSFTDNSLFIFDAWDEISGADADDKKKELSSIIGELLKTSRSVIVTSRYNPANEKEKEAGAVFNRFRIAELLPFTQAEIQELVGTEIDTESRFFELMENTMYLCMYLDLDLDQRKSIADTENRFEFIYKYFELLLKNKNQVHNNLEKLYRDLGEQVYKQMKMDKIEPVLGTLQPVFNNIVEEYFSTHKGLDSHVEGRIVVLE